MNKKSEKLSIALYDIRAKAIKEINRIIKKYKIESINFMPYYDELITNYTFYDTDKNGNGEALQVASVKVANDTLALTMYTSYGSYFGETNLEYLSTTEVIYFLEMLEEVVEQYEENGTPILKEDEEFDEE